MRPQYLLTALCLLVFGTVGACAQSPAATVDQDKWTLQLLLPPAVLLPPNSQLKSGALDTPSSTALLQNSTQTQSPRNPGFRLTIPSR